MLSSVLLAAWLCAAPAAAPAAAAPRVLERILAIVDGRPILLSDVAALQALKGVTRREAVDAMVDETLMLREAVQIPQSDPTAEELERAIEALRAGWPDGAGPAPDGVLRGAARRQLRIVKYIEFRFRAKARVDDAAVRGAYDAENPGGGEAGYASAAPGLRERLERRRLDEEVEAWVKELRSAAEIRYNPERAPPE